MLPALYFVVLGIVLFLVILRPHLIMRPSMWFVLSMLARINYQAAFAGPELDEGYDLGYSLRLLTLLFPMIIVVWVLATPGFSRQAKILALRCRQIEPSLTDGQSSAVNFVEKRVALGFLFISTIIILAYLRTVPLMSTGLVLIFTDPLASIMAREEGLKLLTSPFIRYSYVWHSIVFAPILVGLLAQAKLPFLSMRNFLRAGLIIALLLSVMLTGARAPGARIIIILGFIYFLRAGLWRGSLVLFPSAGISLVLAALLTKLRQGELATMDMGALLTTVSNGMVKRTFETQYLTGVWANHLAQDIGHFGVSSIRPVAKLFGAPYIDYANLVGLEFVPNDFATISANTCFLFLYQASFGLFPGWLLSAFLICGLDFTLVLFDSLRGRLLVAFFASFLVSNMVLGGANFTAALFTHGILVIAIFAWVAGIYTARIQK